MDPVYGLGSVIRPTLGECLPHRQASWLMRAVCAHTIHIVRALFAALDERAIVGYNATWLSVWSAVLARGIWPQGKP